jgi:hypothetical protein
MGAKKLRVIIAGSRSYLTNKENTPEALAIIDAIVKKSKFKVGEVVCGGAKGVDMAGCYWAKSKDIPVKFFLPDWEKQGREAGLRRNDEMIKYADALIALWDGTSKGTQYSIIYANIKGIKVFVHREHLSKSFQKVSSPLT